MNDIFTAIPSFSIGLFFKIAILILLLLFVLFTVILFNNARSLQKIFRIADTPGAALFQILAVVYLCAAAFLFLLAIAIL